MQKLKEHFVHALIKCRSGCGASRMNHCQPGMGSPERQESHISSPRMPCRFGEHFRSGFLSMQNPPNPPPNPVVVFETHYFNHNLQNPLGVRFYRKNCLLCCKIHSFRCYFQNAPQGDAGLRKQSKGNAAAHRSQQLPLRKCGGQDIGFSNFIN